MAGCAKCGSDVLIDHARVIYHGHLNSAQDLAVTVYRNPGAAFFREGVSGPLHATVCGSCGYTELYVTNSGELVEAFNEGEKARKEHPETFKDPWYWRCTKCRRINAPSSKECMGCSTSRGVP
jgi:hypothetical protein